MHLVIGVDLDNTLACYDSVIYDLALQRGLIPSDITGKQRIRDKVRELPDGEIQWQRLQGAAYGVRMGEARLIDGVHQFFDLCKRHKVRTYIVSHKTEFAKLDETRTELRVAALAWLAKNRFFDGDGCGLSTGDVYFESTRDEKISRIAHLGCTHFIDDLEETFLDDSFPKSVERILFAPHFQSSPPHGIRVVKDWAEIRNYFFGTGN